MNEKEFQYIEDLQYFADVFTNGDINNFLKIYKNCFDFSPAQIKRAQFNKIRDELFKGVKEKYNGRCGLMLLDECEIDKNLVIDHYIPLSTNILNKEIRRLKAEKNHKVESQSFGSNHLDNLVLSCSKCNSFKKHRIIKSNFHRI